MRIFGRIAALGVLLVPLVIAGCGGGGGGSTSDETGLRPRANFKLSVDWPERTRAVQGVGSADSVALEAAEGDELASVTGNRPAGTSSQTVQYVATTALRTGLVTVRARFYAAPGNELGRLVGRADFVARLQTDGSLTKANGQPLPPIQLVKTIESVEVAAGQSVTVGQTEQIVATALDENGAAVAIDPGAYSFQVTSGQSSLTITPDGIATGLAAGTATIVATVDGVASAPVNVTVVEPVVPIVNVVEVDTNDIAYDATRNIVWGATINPSPQGASIVPINAANGNLGTPIPLSSEPRRVVITDDGQYLYAALTDGTIQRINAGSATLDIAYNVGGQADDIAIVPGQPHALLVAVGGNGTVYDDAVPRPNSLAIGHSLAFGANASTVYGYQRFEFGAAFIRRVTVDASGLTLAQESTTAISGFGNRIHYGDNRIYGDDGTILDAGTFANLGTFGPFGGDRVMTSLPGTGKVAFIAWDPKTLRFFNVSDQSELDPVSVGPLDGGCEDIEPAGTNRVVFRTFGGDQKVVIVSGLQL